VKRKRRDGKKLGRITVIQIPQQAGGGATLAAKQSNQFADWRAGAHFHSRA
jgi:hypothetical protein